MPLRLPSKSTTLILAGAVLAGAFSCHAPSNHQDEWFALFDGESLKDWTPKIRGHECGEDPYQTFRVEDGVIKIGYENYEGNFDGRFGHLFYDEEFSHYLLKVEYRFVGEQHPGGPGWAWRNSGLMLHGQRPETMGTTQEFPVSIEMQLLGGDGKNERANANLCTPGTNVVMNDELVRRHCTNSTSLTCHGDEWYTVTVEVLGGEVIRHFLGEDLVLEYQQPQLDDRDADAQRLINNGELLLTSGTISLQSESHPMEYRSVEIKILD
jgi:hypothetical protein